MNTTKNNFLVDKQTAINILHTCLPGIPLKRLNEIFSAMPSAQAERKKGKWIPVEPNYGYYQCSNCGFEETIFHFENYNYCTCCGADMRDKEDG